MLKWHMIDRYQASRTVDSCSSHHSQKYRCGMILVLVQGSRCASCNKLGVTFFLYFHWLLMIGSHVLDIPPYTITYCSSKNIKISKTRWDFSYYVVRWVGRLWLITNSRRWMSHRSHDSSFILLLSMIWSIIMLV